MNHITYDPVGGSAYVRIADNRKVGIQELSDVCIADLDADGGLAAVELLSVFGFAGASLMGLAERGLLTTDRARAILAELQTVVLAARAAAA